MATPLVVGNVAQNDRNRLALGCSGAIEALFLLAESPDQDIQRNAMWALSNLAWAPDNQERIGCFLGQLVRLCRSKWVPVQANALVALANSLFFHDGNRRRLGHMPGALQRLMALVRAAPGAKAQEHALRKNPDRLLKYRTRTHQSRQKPLVKLPDPGRVMAAVSAQMVLGENQVQAVKFRAGAHHGAILAKSV